MKNRKVNKSSIIKSVTKMASDKEVVRSYMKGETDQKIVNKKGIKFAKPI